MKYFLILCIILSIVSCSRPKIVYNTGSNMDDVSQIPITSKQKGDLDLNVSGSFQTGYVKYSSNYQNYTRVIFKSYGSNSFNTKIHYSILDDLAIGWTYQRFIKSNFNFSQGHTFGPSINFSKNRYTKAQKAVYGFDISGAIQYRTANNDILVNEMYQYFFPFFPPFVGEAYGDTISAVQINQKLIKYSLQTSFSIEMKNFHLFLGTAVVYQNQFKYRSPQLSPTQSQLEEVEFEEPFGYYNRKKSEWANHIFYGFGVGPAMARFNIKFAHVTTTDPFNKEYFTFNMGITSKFNVKKENRMNPKFAPSKKKSSIQFFL